jgi:exodeoxyribonuclease V gamma subunit
MAVPGPPRPGDRSRRDDDRYIFLETLLSARDVFYVSYVGRDIRDNAESPPSVLVCELADYIEKPVLQKHWLQPFNPRYFSRQSGLFSFSRDHYRALKQSLKPRVEAGPLVPEILGEPEASHLTTDVRDFTVFFQNPAKALLEKRMGIFYREKPGFEEKEPFQVDPLDAYFVCEGQARALLEGRAAVPLYEITREQGILPHANPGRAAFSRLSEDVNAFRGAVSALTRGGTAASMQVQFEKSGITVSGALENLFEDTQLIIRPAVLKPKHLVHAWIRHLCMNTGAKGRTVLLCRNRTVTLRPPDNAPEILETLCGWFKQGLRTPFLFFPDSACEYARIRLGLKRSSKSPLEAAAEKWDAQDPYLETCFGEAPPLSSQFEENALAFFGPLFEHDEAL